jgi:CBS domain-containing protein
MVQRIQEIMTAAPTALPEETTLVEAARVMRDQDVGDVLVERDGELTSIVTDRDIVIRALAEDRSPADTALREVASKDLVTLTPKDPVDKAVKLMRERAIRRIPVVEDGRPVGIVSIGDLAVERDSRSALADISAAEPNE